MNKIKFQYFTLKSEQKNRLSLQPPPSPSFEKLTFPLGKFCSDNNGWYKDNNFSRHALKFFRALDILRSVATRKDSKTHGISLPKMSSTALGLLEEAFGEMFLYFGLTHFQDETKKYLMFLSFYETFSRIILSSNRAHDEHGAVDLNANIKTHCSCTNQCYNNWYEEAEVIWQLMLLNLRYYAE